MTGKILTLLMVLSLLPMAPCFGATLIAHYTFDGNVLDSSGNNFDGIIEGTGTTFTTGQIGQAITFDGNGWVRVADDPALEFGTGDFTVSLWASFYQ